MTDEELLDVVRTCARKLVDYEPDYPLRNEETGTLVEEMLRMARTWRRARDAFRRLDDGGD